MSMTGGVSFFDKSQCLFKDGATCVASSNTAAQNLVLSNDKYYQWESSGSDDMTTETLTITLPVSTTFNRIFILGHNLKAFQISITGDTFANLSSEEGTATISSGDIDQTNCAKSTSYFEFDNVTGTEIVLTMDTTQTVDAEKYVGQVIVTTEIGTLTGFPNINDLKTDPNIIKDKTISGKYIIEKGAHVANFDMKLTTYPVQADIDILDSLFIREDPFLVWLCGGKTSNFRLTQRGWRLGDVYQMQVDSDLKNGFRSNVYALAVNQSYGFQEVV
jgi:hypothetical protein